MKKMVAIKRLSAPLSIIKIKAKRHFWPGASTDLHDANVIVERKSRKTLGKVITKEKEFVIKSMRKNNPMPLAGASFTAQVDMHSKILNIARKNGVKLNVVPTLRLITNGVEQSLIRTKLDAISISQLSREHPDQIKPYHNELNFSIKQLNLLGFSAGLGSFAPVKGKDGKYHPMLIDFANVGKKR